MSSPVILTPAPRRGPAGRRARVMGLLTGVLLTVAVTATALGLWLGRGSSDPDNTDSQVPIAWQRPVAAAESLAERSGVQITQVAVTGGGGLVDLRFRVIDPELANTLHDKTTPPAVVDEQTGLVVHELLMDHAHSGQYQAGVTYYLVFTNPGNWVQRGSRVSVLLGNAQVEHVVVQ